MKASFSDLRVRIAEEPTWYDANGTPRYGAFSPDQCPDIYATEVVLIDIRCQGCKKQFMIEMHSDPYLFTKPELSKLLEMNMLGAFHYGDPPVHHCVGDTMNCLDIKIVEFWQMTQSSGWKRVPELEVELLDVKEV